ncbi:MAG: sigma-70 family RNA polymerase sigma factor [Ekhidna sp.]|nr:sigma-70 family RNA polymerase sigma factor [Ekhidna sp.]
MEELNRQFSDKALRDFKLIDLAAAGKDQTAYATLMDRYKNSVYHTILKMVRNVDDAEDLTIESFAKAFKNLDQFKKDFTFSTWLFRIATNSAIDFLKKKKLDTLSLSNPSADESREQADIDVQDKNLTPDQEAIKDQKIKLVRIFVDKLPPKYQRLLKLRYFEECSYEEIAKEVEVPIGTVKVQLHRAKNLLYQLVKDKKSHI